MIKIKQHDVEIILKEIAEQSEKRIINLGIPVLVTYHAFVVNNRLMESRISVNRIDVQNYTPVVFNNKKAIIKILKGKRTVYDESVENALNYTICYC